MRWVYEIFPPRVRRSWLLITSRLSASSFAGTARTLVAVGTSSDASMLRTTAEAAPRSVVVVPSSAAADGRAAREVVPAAGLSAVVGVPEPAGAAVAVGTAPFFGARPLPVRDAAGSAAAVTFSAVPGSAGGGGKGGGPGPF